MPTPESIEALPDIRVVELCDEIPGAYCARQFAAWGAQVTVLELEGGSPLRLMPPFGTGSDGTQLSFLWEWVAAGKETAPIASVDVDLLLGAADVFVTDWTVDRLAAFGLAPETLAARFAGLVIVTISSFGADGPYAAHAGTDLTVQALSGLMMINGLPGQPPLRAPANIIAYSCGVGAFVGALAALYERRTSGRGQRIELACLELVTTLVSLLRVQYSGQSAQRAGGPGAFTALYPAKDGYVAFTATSWESILVALGVTEDEVPEGLRTPLGRQDRDAVARFIASRTPELEAEWLFNEVGALGERTGLLRTPFELAADPHLRDRQFFFQFHHPLAGDLTIPGAPGRLSATPMVPPLPVTTAKTLQADPRPTGRSDHSAAPPLSGVRVVDLTQGWIGPYATQMLADLGADVIKVESPERPDVWRGAEAYGPQQTAGAPPDAHHWNTSSSFNMVNRNKRDLGLNLNTADGKDILVQLMRRADIVIENYTPRVMRNFGFDYERLKQINQRLVMSSSSGYGSSGPYAQYKANGATTEASSGWDALLGYPNGRPLMLGGMQADAITGLQFAAMTLVALLARDRTGAGQWVETAMYECAITYIGEQVMHASLVGEQAARHGNRDSAMAPHNAFPCAGDDEWIAIAVRDDSDWQRLLTVAPKGALHEPRFTLLQGRLDGVEALERELAAWTSSHDKHQLANVLQAAGVPAAPVLRDVEVLRDPHLVARKWFLSLTHPDMGTHLQHGHPWRFSRTRPVCKSPAPLLGQHSEEILREELGLDANEIRRLYDAGVTGTVLKRESP